MPTTVDTKDLRQAIQSDLSVKQAEVERLAAAFPQENGKFALSTEMYTDYTRAVNAAKQAKSALTALDEADGIRQYLDDPEGPSEAAMDAGMRHAGMEGKTLADVFIESKAYQRARDGSRAGDFFADGPQSISAHVEGKSMFSLSGGTVTHNALGSVQTLGIGEMARRKMHIRDLFPKSTTKASLLYGVREVGWVNNAAQVKERYAADGVSAATGAATDVYGRAPRSSINLDPVTYPIGEIAHLLDAHKNILADEPRLRTFINFRMVEGVKYAEDYDLLWSAGDGETVTGLFNTPYVQTFTGAATDKYSVQVRRSITRALLAEYEPSGLIISPAQWEMVEVEEDDNGQFRVAVSVAIGATKRVWRLNVVETTAMPDTRFVVGAFGLGAQLHDREMVSVKVSTENSDNMERGVVTFRADERLAFEVPRPESFVIGTWTEPTAGS